MQFRLISTLLLWLHSPINAFRSDSRNFGILHQKQDFFPFTVKEKSVWTNINIVVVQTILGLSIRPELCGRWYLYWWNSVYCL